MNIEIIDYDPKYRRQFREINLEWLDRYNLTETHDLEVLDDPQKTVLDPGGFIFLAIKTGDVVGSAALIPTSEGEFELAKMCVRPDWQGRGLMQEAVQAVLAYSFETLHLHLVEAYLHRDNKRSVALLKRTGFVFESTEKDMLIYSQKKPARSSSHRK